MTDESLSDVSAQPEASAEIDSPAGDALEPNATAAFARAELRLLIAGATLNGLVSHEDINVHAVAANVTTALAYADELIRQLGI